MKLVQSLFERKFGFWFYQCIGWVIFIIQDLVTVVPQFVSVAKVFWLWVILMCYGFCISLVLRLIYRKIYSFRKSAAFNFLSIVVFSILAGFIWYLLKDIFAHILNIVIQYSLLKNIGSSISILQFTRQVFFMTWPLLVWSTLYYLIKYRNDFLDEKEKSERERLYARDAQLQLLRYQINPHFLFNTMNSIQGLMYKDTAKADEMLTEFSELLRYTLQYDDKTFIPLGSEVEIIRKYLFIEKIRFEDRLDYSIKMKDDTEKIEILCFLIQSFVENAIKHGLKSNPDQLQVSINSYRKSDKLCIDIENNGPWITESDPESFGIKNSVMRLKNAYPEKHRFRIHKGEHSVRISIKIDLP